MSDQMTSLCRLSSGFLIALKLLDPDRGLRCEALHDLPIVFPSDLISCPLPLAHSLWFF